MSSLRIPRERWTPAEIQSLKDLCESGKHRFVDIAKLINRSYRAVMFKCYEQGFNNQFQTAFKYTYDRDFFSRVTLETAYWAAILTTDGCVSWRNGRPTIYWGAAIKDQGHVEAFKTAIQSTHPLNRRENRCNLSTTDTHRLHQSVGITLESAFEWTADLERHFGVTHNKTLRCPPPNLPTLQHKLAYIRGYIDGDGTITVSSTSGIMDIAICGVNREMIAWVREVVESMDLPKAKKGPSSMIYQPSNEQCYYYQVRGFRAAVLFELLRRLPVPNLARKWDNPVALERVAYWKARTDLWPPETFFCSLLGTSELAPVAA